MLLEDASTQCVIDMRVSHGPSSLYLLGLALASFQALAILREFGLSGPSKYNQIWFYADDLLDSLLRASLQTLSWPYESGQFGSDLVLSSSSSLS